MSHCIACDILLTATEAGRKHKGTKEEIGLCDKCLNYVEEVQHIPIIDPYGDYLTELEDGSYHPNELQFGGYPEDEQ